MTQPLTNCLKFVDESKVLPEIVCRETVEEAAGISGFEVISRTESSCTLAKLFRMLGKQKLVPSRNEPARKRRVSNDRNTEVCSGLCESILLDVESERARNADRLNDLKR